jgi:hypothetical protein
LSWTSQGATTCTASGGWSGSRDLNSSAPEATPALTATTTFTLTCDGSGGSTAKSVTVTVQTPAQGGGGGGGALDLGVLAVLASLLLWQGYYQRNRRS